MMSGDWSADSKQVFISGVKAGGIPVVLGVSEGGKAEEIYVGQAGTGSQWMIQSPDGRHAILEMPSHGDNNAWMVEDF
jgi:hypothetical protein